MQKLSLLKKWDNLSPYRKLIFGFLIAIFIGVILLKMPFSLRENQNISVLDSLFTIVSAICVTGLSVVDVSQVFTSTGQLIILFFIQLGGLGVMTVSIIVFLLVGKKMSFETRELLKEERNSNSNGGITKFIKQLLLTVFVIEISGALILTYGFSKYYSLKRSLFYGLFHSVSAFCNAGSDLMGDVSKFSSLTKYQSDIMINITIMLLILIGGLGFLIWKDIFDYRFDIKRYSTQTKIVLTMTSILVLFPSILFFFTEFRGLDIKTRVLSSLFQAVTPRTAGFNTIDYTKFSDNGIAMTVILMLIGGGSGSTAGGIKMSTVFILVAIMCSVLKQDKEVAVFKRRIEPDIIKNAVAVAVLDITLFIAGSMLISGIEGFSLKETMFESASAVATVGLTLGITPSLGTASKLLLICMMYIGRVGGITLIFAAVTPKNNGNARYPKDQVAVG